MIAAEPSLDIQIWAACGPEYKMVVQLFFSFLGGDAWASKTLGIVRDPTAGWFAGME